MFGCHSFAQCDTHPDYRHSFHNFLSGFLAFCPNPTSMQNLDGIEEVIKGQHLVATCLVREDKHRLTVRHFRDCQGRDAKRQLHHVELPQFHVLEVIVGAQAVSSSSSSSLGVPT